MPWNGCNDIGPRQIVKRLHSCNCQALSVYAFPSKMSMADRQAPVLTLSVAVLWLNYRVAIETKCRGGQSEDDLHCWFTDNCGL